MGAVLMHHLATLAFFCALSVISAQECPDAADGLQSWSQWNTAGAGQVVTVPAGSAILFDAQGTPVFAGINVYGTLVFDDSKDVSLDTVFLIVHEGGRLQIGSACCPYQHKAIITLYDPANKEDNNFLVGTKVLGADGGTVILYGAVRGPTWTNLQGTLNAGASVLTLSEEVTWAPGDKIIVTSTDFDMDHTEEHIVQSVNGNQVTLQGTLQWRHFGAITAEGVDQRAEVASLTRNIVIQGDEASEVGGFGSHMMFLNGADYVSLVGIEVYRGGQKRVVGRYPVHFHMGMDFSGRAFVKDSSIHHSYQRCLTIHGTSGVEIKRNVAYSTWGHCYFLEDGLEMGNVLSYNLAANVRRVTNGNPDQLLPSDNVPAAFWITHPENWITHNVAVGSEGFGFWYALPEHPTGPSADLPIANYIWPQRVPLRKFMHNKAHTIQEDGLFVDSSAGEGGPYNPVSDVNASQFSYSFNPALGVEAVFSDFTAYKIQNRGAWLKGGELTITRSFFSDCAIGVTFAARSFHRLVSDSIFVGESENGGAPKTDTAYPIRGFEYYDGPVTIKNCQFWKFIPNGIREASALSMLRRDQFEISPTNYAEQIQIMDGSKAVYFPDYQHDGDKNAVFVDIDGSVSGRPPANGRRVTITNRNPWYLTSSCIVREDWFANICPDHFAELTIQTQNVGFKPQDLAHHVELYRDDMTAPREICGGQCPSQNNNNFITAIMMNKSYKLHFTTSSPRELELSLSHVDKFQPGTNEYNQIVVGVCYPPGTTVNTITYNFNNNPAPAASLASMYTNTLNEDSKGTGLWYNDLSGSGYIYFRIIPNEVRTSVNMRQSWPKGDVRFTVTLPPGTENTVYQCTRPANINDPDNGIPPLAAVSTPPAIVFSPLEPRADQYDACARESATEVSTGLYPTGGTYPTFVQPTSGGTGGTGTGAGTSTPTGVTGTGNTQSTDPQGLSEGTGSQSLSGGAIAGIVVGVILFAVLVVAAVVTLLLYRKGKLPYISKPPAKARSQSTVQITGTGTFKSNISSPQFVGQQGSDWTAHETDEGATYYYNSKSGETQWNSPL